MSAVRRNGTARGTRALAPWWIVLLLAGCAAPPPIFPPVDPPLLWPRSAETARYAYVGSLSGETDLGRPRSFWSWIGDLVGGREAPGEIGRATGVAATASGVVYVSDPDGQVVHRFDLDNRRYTALRDADADRRFVMPMGLALAGESLLVADRDLGIVALLDPGGEPRSILGEGRLRGPVGVAVGPLTGRVYVVDVESHRVVALAPDGTELLALGERGTGPGQFNYPTHIACDASENLYVADTLNCRVQVFDREGRFLHGWGRRGNRPGEFSHPKGIACDREGRIYVVDSHFENVQVFTPRGDLLLAIGEEGTGPGEFWLPVGIFVDESETIWIGDSFNHRVQVLRYLGDTPGVEEGRGKAP